MTIVHVDKKVTELYLTKAERGVQDQDPTSVLLCPKTCDSVVVYMWSESHEGSASELYVCRLLDVSRRQSALRAAPVRSSSRDRRGAGAAGWGGGEGPVAATGTWGLARACFYGWCGGVLRPTATGRTLLTARCCRVVRASEVFGVSGSTSNGTSQASFFFLFFFLPQGFAVGPSSGLGTEGWRLPRIWTKVEAYRKTPFCSRSFRDVRRRRRRKMTLKRELGSNKVRRRGR